MQAAFPSRMLESDSTRRLLLAGLGGVAWTALLGLAADDPAVLRLAVVVPALLGVGLLEVDARYAGVYGAYGRVGTLLLGGGLAALFVAALLLAALGPGSTSTLLFAYVPLGLGAALVTVGAPFLAVALYRVGALSGPTALLFGAATPVPTFAFNAVFVGRETGFLVGFGGVAWLLVASELHRGGAEPPTGTDRMPDLPDPQAVVATLYGLVLAGVALSDSFLALSSAGVAVYLLVGAASFGIGLVGLDRPFLARRYNLLVGGVSLLAACYAGVAPHLGIAAGPAEPVVRYPFFQFPVGAVLVTVGLLDRTGATPADDGAPDTAVE